MNDPIHPENVPTAATWRPATTSWGEDSPTTLRRWYPDGKPLLEAGLRDGKLHGAVVWFGAPTDDQAELGLPVGPAGSSRLEARYEDGALTTATFFGPSDTVMLSASWRGGKLHGTFDWKPTTEGELLRFGDTVIGALDVKLPKPHPHRGVSEFVDGERTVTTFFGQEGKPVIKVKPLVWDQGTTRESLRGYVVRGDFEADLAAFFPTSERVTGLVEGRPLESWIGALPEVHHPAARAFDALVRSGRFPKLGRHFDVSAGYGFDAAKSGLPVDPRFVGLSSDGAGNRHLLDTTTGRVLGYEHDGGGIDTRKGFEDLDAYTFAMTRIEAAAVNRIPKKKVEAVFEELGLSGL